MPSFDPLGKVDSRNPMPVRERRGFYASASFTPAAGAYGALDIMSTAKTLTWADSDGNLFWGGLLKIISLRMTIAASALQASEAAYALKMYSVTPPSARADNAAWDLPSGDIAAYVGSQAIVAPTDVGSALVTETDNINKIISVASTGLTFAELVTVPAFTPTAVARVVTLFAEAI